MFSSTNKPRERTQRVIMADNERSREGSRAATLISFVFLRTSEFSAGKLRIMPRVEHEFACSTDLPCKNN